VTPAATFTLHCIVYISPRFSMFVNAHENESSLYAKLRVVRRLFHLFTADVDRLMNVVALPRARLDQLVLGWYNPTKSN